MNDTQKIHPEFASRLSPTGRLSSHPPVIQNIPIRTQEARDIRDAFHGRDLTPGELTAAEVRIAARVDAHKTTIEAALDNVPLQTLKDMKAWGELPEVNRRQRRRKAAIARRLRNALPQGVSLRAALAVL